MQTVLSLVDSGMALVPSVTAKLASKSLVFRPVDGMPASPAISIALAFHTANENAALARFREAAHAMPA